MIRLLLTILFAATWLSAAAPHIVLVGEPRNPNPQSNAKDFHAIVSFDGSGTHTTIQAAIDAVPADSSAGQQFRILVKPGVYREHVVIPAGKKFIELTGEPGKEQETVITMGTNVKTPDPENPGTSLSAQDSSTVLIDAPDVTCRHLTFENTTTREEHVQALACFIRGDRVSFFNCRFLGWQDTLRPDSWGGESRRQYFRDCYIEGHCDYIYAAGTAVFDRCTIHTKADGYITAASTAESTPFGFVFFECKVTTGPGVNQGVYLGRPWRPTAHTAFIRCEMDGKVLPAGWHNWDKAENEVTARYYEFGSTGPGARPDQRAPWAKTLTNAEAEKWSPASILNAHDGWNPVR
jgi:pectinesterase